MKKLMNEPAAVVREYLQGLARLDAGLCLIEDAYVLLDRNAGANAQRGQVAVISGGGGGHEPAHAGFVGPGLLSAAVSGEVFTSPSVDAVLAAIRAVAGRAGVLLVVKNYTGDRLNFGLAAELARAEGIATRMVVVADDVSIADAQDTAGRRGLAGTLFVHKVAGAAAAAGLPLDAVAREAQAAADGVRTMGVALTGCSTPAAGRRGFELADEEMELGLGIHGEPGVKRTALASADALADELVRRLVDDLRPAPGARIALLVNGLGATPAMELGLVARRAVEALQARGLVVERALCGSFMTALDMAGCSLSVLLLDALRLQRLDAPVSAPAWPARLLQPPAAPGLLPLPAGPAQAPDRRADAQPAPAAVRACLRTVADALRADEARLTEMDRVVGDGDLGSSLARGADAVLAELDTGGQASTAGLLQEIAGAVRRNVGGTSGPLYAIGLMRLAHELQGQRTHDLRTWATAGAAAADAIAEAGGARLGDRTMLDALLPAMRSLCDAAAQGQGAAEALQAALQAAQDGAAATARVVARRGRASYLGERAIGHPDPGAVAVASWLAAIARNFHVVAEPV